MNRNIYSPLQLREVFHLQFLRWAGRKFAPGQYCVKGGVNLRLFFSSIRYSEDMDIDIARASGEKIQKTVMTILATRPLLDSLKTFGIERVVPPDLTKAKQTETTQRFKIHLLTSGGEDLFTKIEFSRRGLKGSRVVESVSADILRFYKMAPLLVPHYDAASAVAQKIEVVAQRAILQARDIFDLFILSSQYEEPEGTGVQVIQTLLKKAHDHVFLVGYHQFRDTVVAYLGHEDQKAYSSPAIWDEIRLKTARFLEELKNGNE